MIDSMKLTPWALLLSWFSCSIIALVISFFDLSVLSFLLLRLKALRNGGLVFSTPINFFASILN